MSHVKITGFSFYLISQYDEEEGLNLSDFLDFFNLIYITIIYYSLEIHMQIRKLDIRKWFPPFSCVCLVSCFAAGLPKGPRP